MNARSRNARSRSERGAVGGVEGLVFGVLIFVFGTLVLVDAWGVIDAKMATSAAAREASRAYVEAPSASSAFAAAQDAANQAMQGHNRTLASFSVDASGGIYRRCQPVRATVTVKVPRVPLPLIGRPAGVIAVTSSHTEVVDPYRSGVAGIAVCAP